MDRRSLRRLLDAENVDPAAYRLDGQPESETYVLEPGVAQWAVYYSERGLRTPECVFDTEDDACRHLLDLLLTDFTTRRQPPADRQYG